MKRQDLILVTVFLASLSGCAQKKADTSEASPLTKPVEEIKATKDQAERRAKSEAICESKGVPIYKNPTAMFVGSEAEVTLRTQDEVVDRVFALCYIGLKSEGLEQKHLDQMDKDFGIMEKLSPKEKAYATAASPTQQQKVDANWRYESLHVLLWALGYIDTLSYPDQLCNVGEDVKIIYERKATKFRQQAKLRSKKEILDQADLILRLDWACVNARVNNQEAPGGLDSSVVFERHHSLNWLIKYLDQYWDDVTTDT